MNIFSKSKNAEAGDVITLQRQDVEVVECDECDHLMVNLDEDELRPGDLVILKRKGVRISNPHTTEEVCVDCEYDSGSNGRVGAGLATALSSWFDDDDDDDDSSFFSTPSHSSTPSFGGGFGGFGGGSFSGGGASRSF